MSILHTKLTNLSLILSHIGSDTASPRSSIATHILWFQCFKVLFENPQILSCISVTFFLYYLYCKFFGSKPFIKSFEVIQTIYTNFLLKGGKCGRAGNWIMTCICCVNFACNLFWFCVTWQQVFGIYFPRFF